MSTPSPRRPVLCFGEILWDFLPEGLFAGGAPFNVAYHLHQLGCPARIVSAVGDDLLGSELIRRLEGWGIATDLVGRRRDVPTGYVRATLDARGDAHYEITRDVAWDRIEATDALRAACGQARAAVFGSLAQRSAGNRAALRALLQDLPEDALRVFDVNLRPPHDDPDLVRELARLATVLKLNHGEAARLAGDRTHAEGREESHARTLARSSGARWVCVTAGARGAGLLHDDVWHWEPGRAVEVVDTVGAGDAFLASLVSDLATSGDPVAPAEVLRRACRLGEWVATQRGATPPYANGRPARE